jgi:hypothetical protein
MEKSCLTNSKYLQKSVSEGKLVELSQNETLEESWVEITHLDDIFAKVKNGSLA